MGEQAVCGAGRWIIEGATTGTVSSRFLFDTHFLFGKALADDTLVEFGVAELDEDDIEAVGGYACLSSFTGLVGKVIVVLGFVLLLLKSSLLFFSALFASFCCVSLGLLVL